LRKKEKKRKKKVMKNEKMKSEKLENFYFFDFKKALTYF